MKVYETALHRGKTAWCGEKKSGFEPGLPLICCAILGKFPNLSGPQFPDLYDGLIKSQRIVIYIYWEIQVKGCCELQSTMKMFLYYYYYYYQNANSPSLSLEKRVNEREMEVCKLHNFPCSFPEIFSADVFDGESITVPSKIHRHFSERLGIPWFSSVHFSCSLTSDSLWPHEPQHARPPCPSPTPGVPPNPYPLSRWCHPTVSSSVVPFSSCPQSFPASGSFQMSQLFASGGQSIGVSASTSVLPMNILVAQLVRNPPAMQETWVWSLG